MSLSPWGSVWHWDEAAQKVTVTLGDKTLELWVGKSTARVNGQDVMIALDNPGVMLYTVLPGGMEQRYTGGPPHLFTGGSTQHHQGDGG